ncbi:MAG: presqualene diphosphate synthase HpnD [Elusimicrobia bacterium]|nr:presqualene diphosphate synthase HpnD [Elusimicrobiota bacterium]
MSAQAPETRSNFYLGFLFLPKPKRAALADVYGFCRHIDDIVDSGTLPKEESQKLLDTWREEIERLYDGGPTQPMAKRLLPHVREYSLPKAAFLDVIRGCEMDLNLKRYATFEELEPYLQGVAVAVGRLCIEIFGYPNSSKKDAQDYAKNMGYAFQLTNIMRDVGADLELGRVYLPQDEMKAAGYTSEMLLKRSHTPEFRALMSFQYDRAKAYYKRARNCISPKDRRSVLPAEVMAAVYEDVLDEIKSTDYRVLFHRVSLSRWRKAQLAFKAWMRSRSLI